MCNTSERILTAEETVKITVAYKVFEVQGKRKTLYSLFRNFHPKTGDEKSFKQLHKVDTDGYFVANCTDEADFGVGGRQAGFHSFVHLEDAQALLSTYGKKTHVIAKVEVKEPIALGKWEEVVAVEKVNSERMWEDRLNVIRCKKIKIIEIIGDN